MCLPINKTYSPGAETCLWLYCYPNKYLFPLFCTNRNYRLPISLEIVIQYIGPFRDIKMKTSQFS